MLQIRAITEDELNRFAHIGGGVNLDEAESVKRMTRTLWDSGDSHPDWCFVAEADGVGVARVGYRRFPPFPADLRLFGLLLPWQDDYLEVGLPLLHQSLAQMQGHGFAKLVRQLSSYWANLDEQRTLLEDLGLTLTQEKSAFVWQASQPLPALAPRLRFRALGEVGEAQFVDAMRRVTDGTLDRVLHGDAEHKGGIEAARTLFEELREYDHEPEWWLLAYDGDDALVGLVAPVLLNPTEGTIGYIGTVPEQRGKGYAHDLLVEGTARLQAAGVASVFSDTDSRNLPMMRVFERAGYQHDSQVWIYEAELASL